MDDKRTGVAGNDSDPTLDNLVNSISDGDRVDWSTAESAAGLAQTASIRALREVSRIVDFNRALQRSPEADAFPAAAAAPGNWGTLNLLERVGTGASGEVWRAWDPKLQRQVALKFLQLEQEGGAQRLLDEARALARVRHPGVVIVHGIDEQDGRPGMWMEFLHGVTLAEEIERRGSFAPSDVIRIGAELCAALDAVHAAGVVHRDLKPANIILEADGRAVLTDFGLGWRRAVDRPGTSGTPVFMSPGVLAGEPASPRSDVYALGVTLRWALTGKPPFRAADIEALKAEAAAGPARSILAERPDTPPELAAVLDRAMAPDTDARFSSAEEMGRALRGISGETGASAAAGVPQGVTGRGGALDPDREQRSLAMGGMAVAAVVGALLVGAWFLTRPTTQQQAPPPADRSAAEVSSEIKPAVPTEALPVSAGYDIEATIVQRSEGAFKPLSAGDRVGPGDRLSLQFSATKPMWVYVLNQDETGETYLLFPQPLFDIANPVAAGSTTLLPGPVGGQENAWTVTSRGGREHFLVVASPEPIAEIEADLAKLPAVRNRPVQYAAVPPATVERLRGVGGVAPLPAGAPSTGAGAFERFQALAGRETVARGPWVRKITLENPIQ